MLFQVRGIKGLYVLHNALNDDQYKELVDWLSEEDKGHPCEQIHKATEFGWKFIPLMGADGKIKVRTQEDFLGPFPDVLVKTWKAIYEKLRPFKQLSMVTYEGDCPDHLLINKYPIGDGCKSHTDELDFWEEWIVGLSMGSGCSFDMSSGSRSSEIFLPKNSVYVLSDDSRYQWKHGIPFRVEDTIYGDVIKRDVRYSLTWRNIKDKYLPDKSTDK
jgi:alkylated DNA repair dioxygenase AlkB